MCLKYLGYLGLERIYIFLSYVTFHTLMFKQTTSLRYCRLQVKLNIAHVGYYIPVGGRSPTPRSPHWWTVWATHTIYTTTTWDVNNTLTINLIQLTITARLCFLTRPICALHGGVWWLMPHIGETQVFLIFTAILLSFHISFPSYGTSTIKGHFFMYITPICQKGISDSLITSN